MTDREADRQSERERDRQTDSWLETGADLAPFLHLWAMSASDPGQVCPISGSYLLQRFDPVARHTASGLWYNKAQPTAAAALRRADIRQCHGGLLPEAADIPIYGKNLSRILT